MDNESMPFRWRLRDRDEQMVKDDYDCENMDDNETKTIINKDSMECTFAIYNGKDYSQQDDDDVNTFTVDCFEEEDSISFDYFEESYDIDFDEVSGKYVKSVDWLFDGN
jgi:hypothetical protein